MNLPVEYFMIILDLIYPIVNVPIIHGRKQALKKMKLKGTKSARFPSLTLAAGDILVLGKIHAVLGMTACGAVCHQRGQLV